MPLAFPTKLGSLAALIALGCLLPGTSVRAAAFDVRAYGATGDGKKLDTEAINKAIEAAATAGGGTVLFPTGTYLSFSIRLKSHIALQLEAGCTLVAATPATDGGAYDPPEPNEWGDKQYQDFGHSHWHDSLIWGENLEDVSITGKKISLRLPSPQITDAYLDDHASQVIDHTTGLLRAFDKDLEQSARQNAVDDIARAARRGGILDEAEKRGRTELENFFKRAGFERVEFR